MHSLTNFENQKGLERHGKGWQYENQEINGNCCAGYSIDCTTAGVCGAEGLDWLTAQDVSWAECSRICH